MITLKVLTCGFGIFTAFGFPSVDCKRYEIKDFKTMEACKDMGASIELRESMTSTECVDEQ